VKTEQLDEGDLPEVYGGWAIVREERVLQASIEPLGCCSTHAQGVLSVLISALTKINRNMNRVHLLVPDRAAVDLVLGRIDPRTPVVRQLVEQVKRLMVEKLPNSVVEHGRFYDVVRGREFDDRWAVLHKSGTRSELYERRRDSNWISAALFNWVALNTNVNSPAPSTTWCASSRLRCFQHRPRCESDWSPNCASRIEPRDLP
jgi:hypothetical protein